MSHLRNLATVVLIALLSAAGVQPQNGTVGTKHFAKDRVAFDYPAGWNLTESRLGREQIMTLESQPGSARIVISTADISSCDYQRQKEQLSSALVKKVAQQIRSASPGKSSLTKTQVASAEVEGTQLLGVAKGKQVTADVYSIRLSRRSIGLVYIRAENDEAAASAWDTVRTTLQVEPAVATILGTSAGSSAADRPTIGGVLNGKAIQLPVPSYPPIARQAHASGIVTVQVVIDESGAVMAAHAVSGHPLLQGVSVAAARRAQFSPTTLCDEPVRVTGVITYRFIAE